MIDNLVNKIVVTRCLKMQTIWKLILKPQILEY